MSYSQPIRHLGALGPLPRPVEVSDGWVDRLVGWVGTVRRWLSQPHDALACPSCQAPIDQQRCRVVPGSRDIMEYRCGRCRGESVWDLSVVPPRLRRWRRTNHIRWRGRGW